MHHIIALAALAAGVLLLGRQAARSLRRARKSGYGWECPSCRIIAGHPGDPIPTYGEACAGLVLHVQCTHLDQMPTGAQVSEISWH